MVKGIAVAAVAAVGLTGCFGASGSQTAETHRASPTSSQSQVVAGTCPVTLPNESVPPDATDWGRNDSYGKGKLWTLFWPYNVVVADSGYVEKDGSIGMKWPWWRGVSGTLKIEGRRLDGKAQPIRADIPPDYGQSGFQPSGIYFSTEGCWEVTGKVGGESLTFVTLIVEASSYGLELKRQ